MTVLSFGDLFPVMAVVVAAIGIGWSAFFVWGPPARKLGMRHRLIVAAGFLTGTAVGIAILAVAAQLLG